MNARTIVRRAGSSRAVGSGVALLERLLPPRKNSLHVLMYHRVAEPGERPDLHPALLSATPQGFGAQAAYLASTGRVVSLEDVLVAFRGGPALRPGAILITFDDAYTDFAEHAWPRLAPLELPVTLFVPTAYPGHPERHFWWDRLHAAICFASAHEELQTTAGSLPLRDSRERAAARTSIGERLGDLDHETALGELDRICEQLEAKPPAPAVLSWSELVRINREGVTLAPHTRTHPLLGKMPREKAIGEVVGSRDDLVAKLGHAPPVIAYPGGSYTDELARALPGQDIGLGFTTRRGRNRVSVTDPLRLDRINVGIASELPLLRSQLLLV